MQYITVAQAAAIKQVSRQAVYDAIATGVLTRHELAGTVFVISSEVDSWMPLQPGIKRKGKSIGGRPRGAKNKNNLAHTIENTS